MAKSSKGAGNLMVPMVVVAIGVVVLLVITFSFSNEEVPDEATIIAEDDVDARPAGAGTVPEGEADEEMEGISGEVDEVEPASEGEAEVPATETVADEAATGEADEAIEGETSADEETAAGQANAPVVEGVAGDQNEGEATGGSEADSGSETPAASGSTGGEDTGTEAAEGDEAARIVPEDGSEEDGFLLDEDSDAPASADVDTAGSDEDASMPAGRDAQTDLTTEPGQEVVTDPDDGGAAFVPTPSGPEERSQ